MKAVVSRTGPLEEGLWVAKLESAFEAKELEFQRPPGLDFENSTLRAEVSRLRAFVEAFRREK